LEYIDNFILNNGSNSITPNYDMRWIKEVNSNGKVTWNQKKCHAPCVSIETIKNMSLNDAKKLPIEEKKIWFDLKC
jgi:hypothetical protein